MFWIDTSRSSTKMRCLFIRRRSSSCLSHGRDNMTVELCSFVANLTISCCFCRGVRVINTRRSRHSSATNHHRSVDFFYFLLGESCFRQRRHPKNDSSDPHFSDHPKKIKMSSHIPRNETLLRLLLPLNNKIHCSSH